MNAKWTDANIPDLTGKVITVTGGNSGLGYESSRALALKGATVILASRSLERGHAARDQIHALHKQASVEVMELDLGDLSSVKRFAKAFIAEHKRLDVLMNNAGIMMTPYSLTRDGFESQLGTNHFGHFALTGLLLDVLLATPASRVVNVSSGAHRSGEMDFNNLQFENGAGYTPSKAYGRSKLANLLFTYELQRKLEAAGKSTLSVAAHPGIAKTNLARHMEGKWWFGLLVPFFKLLSQGQDQGALPQIRAGVDPHVKGGEYYGPDGRREMKGDPVIVQSTPASHNQADAAQLWKVSEELTGVRYSQL